MGWIISEINSQTDYAYSNNRTTIKENCEYYILFENLEKHGM